MLFPNKHSFSCNGGIGKPAPPLLYKSILIQLFVALYITCPAQHSIGILQGITLNTISQNQVATTFPNEVKIVPQAGYSSAVYYQQQFSARFWSRIGLQFIQKNYLLERTGTYKGVYQRINNNYIQIPLTGFISLKRKNIKLEFGAGVYAGYWLQSNRESSVPDIFSVRDTLTASGATTTLFDLAYSKEKHIFTKADNRLEFGISCMVNTGYMLKSGNCITASISLLQSMSHQEKEYTINQMKTKNRSVVFSLEYLIRLN